MQSKGVTKAASGLSIHCLHRQFGNMLCALVGFQKEQEQPAGY